MLRKKSRATGINQPTAWGNDIACPTDRKNYGDRGGGSSHDDVIPKRSTDAGTLQHLSHMAP